MLMVGVAFVSLIVPIAVTGVLLAFPELTVPVTVNVSFGSSIASVFVGTLNVAVVCPANIVTLIVVVV